MRSLNKKVFFGDLVFRVTENVYEPAEDSFLFAENLRFPKLDKVVDMGTGCGILGIAAAARARKVLATDINPYAVRCARENAKLNGVAHKMSFVQGDLFAPIRVGERFSLILFNAPYLPSEETEEICSWLERAWSGGACGRNVIDSFICGVSGHLESNGMVLMMQSALSGVEDSLNEFRKQGLVATVVAKRPLPFFETIILLKAEYP